MNKVFIFLFFSAALFAKTPLWSMSKNITLKKDEVYQGEVFQDQLQKPISLRWTMYKNYGLVVLVNYDKFPYQTILYKDAQKDTFKLELFRSIYGTKEAAFLYLTFRNFDEKSHQASLWFGILGDAQFLLRDSK